MIRVTFGFNWVLYKFVFQTDWLGNGRKEICSSRWSSFLYDRSLVGNSDPCVIVLSFNCTLQFWLDFCSLFWYHNIYVLCVVM